MAMRYPHQTYALYPTPHWPEEVKSSYPEDDEDRLEASSPADVTGVPGSRRHSTIKVEDEFNTSHMWHDRPHSQMAQMRHYSHPSVPTINTAAQHMGRVPEHTYQGYGPPQWPMSAHSESSTPTPLYGPVQDPMPVQYASASNYTYQPQEPPSAVSMSPQSSQGGWGSTSSDGADQRADNRSPYVRPMSPMTVMRSDGIRKKNARFEIPKERNLTNIDDLIRQSMDEQEKKELKQQKRLLRNRQAALDSRQRKKTHTEKLEQEKKMFSTQKQEMEDMMTNMENQVAHERERWMQERQQYESYIQNLTYERDEAIRTKTLETGELRRQNNVLKDCVRELERSQATGSRGFSDAGGDNFNADFSSFDNLGIDDDWNDGFSLINGEDLKMEGEDTPQRQLTPRPPPPASEPKTSKQETLISMNTLYMCLLFGAFFTSTTKDSNNSSTNAVAGLPDDYRAEAGNVLKALASNEQSSSTDNNIPATPSVLPTTISGHELSRMTNHASSSLDHLATSLTTPNRHQQAAAAFSLSADSFNHITNPDGIMDSPSPDPRSTLGGRGRSRHDAVHIDDDDDDDLTSHHLATDNDIGMGSERQPTRLESLFRAMQASRDDVDRMSGMSGKARERSVLLDRVPEKVLREFREMVGMANGNQKQ